MTGEKKHRPGLMGERDIGQLTKGRKYMIGSEMPRGKKAGAQSAQSRAPHLSEASEGLLEKLQSKDEEEGTRAGEEQWSRQQDCTCKSSVGSLSSRKAGVVGARTGPVRLDCAGPRGRGKGTWSCHVRVLSWKLA